MDRRRFLAAGAAAAPAIALGASAMPAQAAADAAAARPGRVRTGADILAAQGWQALAGRKVGVLSNPTGILNDTLDHIVDSMVAAGHKPVAAFGPEHGFRGTAQAGGSEGNYSDPRTGIPVYDAYGATADKLAGYFQKAGLDTVVFDIANVGARFYTYTWSMYTAMRAAAKTGAQFVVLDRPDPVGGRSYGPMLDPKYASGVGVKPVVQQLGMTVGELAGFFDATFLPADEGHRLAHLEVHRTTGWRRDQLFAETGQQWVPPSPNMPTPDTALLYPGTCLFEGTTMSTGRGTCRPFEIIGAPNLDWRWAEALNAAHLPGVRFAETYFVPTFDNYVGKTCGGVQVHITDPHRLDAIRTAVTMLVTAKRLYPTVFAWRPDHYIDNLSGSDRLRTMIDKGAEADAVVAAWQPELARFRRDTRRYLLYP